MDSWLAFNVVLNALVGLGYVVIGAQLTLLSDWPRPERMSLFALGLLLGLFRILQAANDLGGGSGTFLMTDEAAVVNVFILVAEGAIIYFLARAMKSKGAGR